MLINHLKSAIRQFRKNPVYASLNILGLAVGTAGFVLVFLWVEHETGYDRFLPGADSVYRVTTDVRLPSGQSRYYALSTSGLAAALKDEYPEVLSSIRLLPGSVLIRRGDISAFEQRFVNIDPGFLEVFPFPLAAGNPAEALRAPRSLLMTREMARKYFGDEDPIGKAVTIDNDAEYRVTGLLAETRGESHLRADFLANPGSPPYFNHSTWNALGIYTYVRLARGVAPAEFEAKIQELATKYAGPRGREIFTYHLQPMTSIHLHSNREAEFAPVVGVAHVRLLSAAAVLILLVACVNFVNLSTARAGRRGREVGVRKILGARRDGLFRQFLSESFLSTFAAFGAGLGLAYIALPWFSSFSGVSLSLDPARHLPGFGALAVAVGLLAGTYPSMVLSSFRPATALKWQGRRSTGAVLLRKGLVVFQYSTAIILLISAGVVAGQMRQLRAKDLGFDPDRILGVRMRSPDLIRDYEGAKRGLLQDPNIAEACAAGGLPGIQTAAVPFVPEGFDGNSIIIRTLFVDHDFIPAMKMKIASGRAFSREIASDTMTAYVINRAAQARFGWTEAVGKTLTCTLSSEPEGMATGRVIGVVEDFHVRSLRQEVEPAVLRVRPEALQFLYLRLRGGDVAATRAAVEEKMKAFQPQFPPETFFLGEGLDRLYLNEERLGRILRGFALLTALVACLGLLGMTAYAAEQRAKEIGIRKVLGAKTSWVLWLLGRESAGLVLLANVLAWPAGYFLMESWLRNFPYRTSVEPPLLVLSGAAALALATLTVSAQAYRAAAADPVKSIRYE